MGSQSKGRNKKCYGKDLSQIVQARDQYGDSSLQKMPKRAKVSTTQAWTMQGGLGKAAMSGSFKL